MPYLLARLDHEYEKYRDLIHDATLTMRPRDYFRRQVFLTYEEDNLGIELLPHIGATNVLWASDYPHGDSTWPHSREAILESGLGQLDEADRQLILWDNAASSTTSCSSSPSPTTAADGYAPLKRRVRPGNAPVCLPPSITSSPLTTIW